MKKKQAVLMDVSGSCSGSGQTLSLVQWQRTFFSVRLTGVGIKKPAVRPHGTWPLIKTVENQITPQIHHCCRLQSGLRSGGCHPPFVYIREIQLHSVVFLEVFHSNFSNGLQELSPASHISYDGADGGKLNNLHLCLVTPSFIRC